MTRIVAGSLRSRLFSWRLAKMLSQNTIVSTGTFLFDLALLWVLVVFGQADKYLATATGFVVATSVHYMIGRAWIFRGSERALASGYLYFFANAIVGLVATMAFFALFTQLGMGLIVARIVASVFAGLAAFLLNAILNFKSI